ncbi:MAG: SpoIIE family protein phosphatase [Opitutae bacterium]|nr:SpoIIE family protein phosphatase [Opitutae bacterium]
MSEETSSNGRNRVLVVDDDPGQVRTLADCLDIEDLDAACCHSGQEALAVCQKEPLHVAIIDLRLPDMAGMELLHQLREINPEIQVIIHTGHATLESAMEAVNVEAFAYVEKMSDPQKLMNHVHNAFIQHFEKYSARLRQEIDDHIESERLLSLSNHELIERNKEMEAELLMAREIQQSLIPNHYPHFPQDQPETEAFLRFSHRYQPSSTLAGDFFFMVPVSNTRAGLFICDVMGHGVRAALITALLRGLIEEMKPLASKPHAFLDEINQGLYRIFSQVHTSIFVTSCYLVADILERKVVYANAGHPPPVLLRRSENRLLHLSALNDDPDIALGLAGDVDYTLQEIQVFKGDSLILYTDGAFEAQNFNGEQVGMKRFNEWILQNGDQPMPELLGNLMQSLEDYCGTNEFGDDVCLFGMDFVR